MNFLELARKRCAMRKYQPKVVEDDKLRYLMECVHMAPSAVNYQPCHFYVVRSADALGKLCQVYHRDWLATAPLIVVACVDHSVSWHRRHDGKDHADIDAAIAIEHLCLAATEQGLSTCWVCNFDAALCRHIMQLPDAVEPIALIPVGYAAMDDNPKQRKPLDEWFSEWPA